MNTTLRAAALAVTTTALTLSLAGPAAAERAIHRDPADTTASLTDLRKVTVSHGPHAVVVKVRFTDLRAHSTGGPSSLSVFLDTDRDRGGPELRLGTGLQEGSDYQLVRTRGWRPVGGGLSCPHRVELVPRRDLAKARVSRACFDDGADVRVAVRMVDAHDGSHPVTDWLRGPRTFTRWLQSV